MMFRGAGLILNRKIMPTCIRPQTISLSSPLAPSRSFRNQALDANTIPPELEKYRNVDTIDIGESLFQGQMERGSPNGYGIWAEKRLGGATYRGDWQDGQRHGEGRFESTIDKWTYEGQFSNDRPHGYGIYISGACTYPDEFGVERTATEVYAGGWKEGTKHGRASVTWCGMQFEGLFENGKKQGMGKLTTTDRVVVYSGQWDQDVAPKLTRISVDGQGDVPYAWTADAWLENGQYHGLMNFRSSKIVFTGTWDNGKLVEHKVLHLAPETQEDEAIRWMTERMDKKIEKRRQLPKLVMAEISKRENASKPVEPMEGGQQSTQTAQ